MPAMNKPMLRRGAAGAEIRSELGEYIRSLREARGMTQADLAKALGLKYYTAISAIEVGRNTVPPERYYQLAEALGVSPKRFMREILRFTNPWAYAMLYAADPKAATEELTSRFGERMGTKMSEPE